MLYAATLGAFLLTTGRSRQRVVLAGSYLFYAADSLPYLGLLALVTLVSLRGGVVLARSRSRIMLAVFIAAVSAPLIFFKLAQFGGLVSAIPNAGVVGAAAIAAVPIGISFYTLQAVGYLVDVYRRDSSPAPDLETHALYLAFFPQLLAGPIERAERLMPQVRALATPSRDDVYIGAKTVLWGYFCKLVVADNIAGIVDRVLENHDRVPAASLPTALCLYSFQIYFDFYGYSMIAIGLGRTFGVRISPNFDRPYLAQSIREFWSRWHITLSTWLRDYIYRPLGGRWHGPVRFGFAIVITFLVSGLWHGASANFLLWGALHAMLFLGADAMSRFRLRLAGPASPGGLGTAVRQALCFSLVSFTWLFFRVEDISVIRSILVRMSGWVAAGMAMQLGEVFFRPEAVVFLTILAVALALDATGSVRRVIETVPQRAGEVARELALVNVMALTLLLFGDLGSRGFIYFRF